MAASNPTQSDFLPDETAALTPEQQAAKDAARARLAAFLVDPASRQIEGFPIGSDEDILALSDPPYYTACPNPFLAEIIQQWQAERDAQGATAHYHREPFATDVSEGKNDPIYNAHSYHTKVPHKAIMRYILHYTDPGDIVLDGFCGTGMTGVAAQLCGDRSAVQSLGYRVDEDGSVYDGDKVISHLGGRKAVLVDLSPAATFIAYNYNTPVDTAAFEREARRILAEVEQEYGWMYETWHPHCDDPNRVKGKINYTVWSEVFLCPNCSHEMVFWESAVDHETGYRISKEQPIVCDRCGIAAPLLNWEIATTSAFDPVLGKTITVVKRIPIRINYSIDKNKHEKRIDKLDLSVIDEACNTQVSNWYPTTPMLLRGARWGDTWRAGIHLGLSHVHHFYTQRNLITWATLVSKALAAPENIRRKLLFWLETVAYGQTLLNRYLAASYSQVNRYLKGTMYIAPFISETNPSFSLPGKIKTVSNANVGTLGSVVIATGSATQMQGPDDSVDYIFVDPPFGSNIMYSDLNFIWEAWLRVITNNGPEAIINTTQNKTLHDFQRLMLECFREFKRILKPGRWLTVEFHNSSNAVWAAIQETISQAGFVVADVRILDKQQETMQQMVSKGSVKQDLIISAYKPNDRLEERFKLQAGSGEGAWAFVRYHLSQVPPVVERDGELETIAERQAYLLFDRMVAFHIRRGATVPFSAAEFYAGLVQRFVERDGMYFLPEQVPAYDAARLRAGQPAQLALFVSDEKSAIQWLRQRLDPALGGRPQTRQDLIPDFQRQLFPSRYETLPELDVILGQNFLPDEQDRWRVPDPTKAGDLEKLRQRALLREFREYTEGSGSLRQFRSEAVRAGFAEAYQRRDFAMILKVAERLPEAVLHEDPDLLMYYDTALLRERQ